MGASKYGKQADNNDNLTNFNDAGIEESQQKPSESRNEYRERLTKDATGDSKDKK
jgi:hypothetical protein